MTAVERDRLRMTVVIVVMVVATMLALGRCEMDGTDGYGQPNPPGYAVPAGDAGGD